MHLYRLLHSSLNNYLSYIYSIAHLNLKKLACELHAALHDPKNIRCVSVSAQEGPPLVESKQTCYKLVTSLSTRARNVNALDTCHTHHQLKRVFHL